MGTAVGGVSRAESRTESEIAAPVIEVCTNFIGRGKPLPYIIKLYFRDGQPRALLYFPTADESGI